MTDERNIETGVAVQSLSAAALCPVCHAPVIADEVKNKLCESCQEERAKGERERGAVCDRCRENYSDCRC